MAAEGRDVDIRCESEEKTNALGARSALVVSGNVMGRKSGTGLVRDERAWAI